MGSDAVACSIVPTFASDRLRALQPLPELETITVDTQNGPVSSALIPADGRGAIGVWPNDASPETLGFMGHLTFDEPIALALLDEWLDDRLSAAGLTPAN